MGFVNEKLKEFETYIKGKKVAIIGLGVSNIPLLDYLYQKGATVSIFDKKVRKIKGLKKDKKIKRTEKRDESSFF